MMIEKKLFGRTRRGEEVTCYQLSSQSLKVCLLDYGATVQAVHVKDRHGRWRDVVLGYDTIEEYEDWDGYFGACVGRVANRIANGEFWLNGHRYPLAKNDQQNHLHGGLRGFDKYVWSAAEENDGIRFYRVSPDGEEGYPGNLSVSVTYRVVDGTLEMIYDGLSDQDTLCNLTNHSYWNLNGAGTVADHSLQVNAANFLENSTACLPTGRILSVEGTALDLRRPKKIGEGLAADDVHLKNCGGYDHNFCLEGASPAAVLHSDDSGITMTLETSMPGVQIYSGNFITPRSGKGGCAYHARDAVCLETQYYPNAMECEDFEKPVLQAGKPYHHVTKYSFSTQ